MRQVDTLNGIGRPGLFLSQPPFLAMVVPCCAVFFFSFFSGLFPLWKPNPPPFCPRGSVGLFLAIFSPVLRGGVLPVTIFWFDSSYLFSFFELLLSLFPRFLQPTSRSVLVSPPPRYPLLFPFLHYTPFCGLDPIRLFFPSFEKQTPPTSPLFFPPWRQNRSLFYPRGPTPSSLLIATDTPFLLLLSVITRFVFFFPYFPVPRVSCLVW